jgi:hypothetical protein
MVGLRRSSVVIDTGSMQLEAGRLQRLDLPLPAPMR